jgi:hypothetical protein
MKKICMLVFMCLLLALPGCGGGGGGGAELSKIGGATRTLRLVATGTDRLIAGVDFTISLPAGVSIATDGTGVVTDAALRASRGAGSDSLMMGTFTPASGAVPAALRVVTVSASGFPAGEFALLTLDIAPGAPLPNAEEFTVSGVKAFDAVPQEIELSIGIEVL